MEENINKLFSAKVVNKNGGFSCPDCGRSLPTIRKHNFCPSCGKKLSYEGISENLPKWDPRMNRPRILIDMDDCINGFMQYLLDVYNERTGSHIKASDIKDWNLEAYIGSYGMSIFREEGFFENIPEKKGSTKTLKKLIESGDYDVFIVTACNSNQELEEKYRWFDKYLPQFNKDRIIKCKEKEIIHGDVLIDDNIQNLQRCSPYMRCILFDMPHNKNCNDFPRIKNLKEIIPMLKEWFY